MARLAVVVSDAGPGSRGSGCRSTFLVCHSWVSVLCFHGLHVSIGCEGATKFRLCQSLSGSAGCSIRIWPVLVHFVGVVVVIRLSGYHWQGVCRVLFAAGVIRHHSRLTDPPHGIPSICWVHQCAGLGVWLGASQFERTGRVLACQDIHVYANTVCVCKFSQGTTISVPENGHVTVSGSLCVRHLAGCSQLRQNGCCAGYEDGVSGVLVTKAA